MKLFPVLRWFDGSGAHGGQFLQGLTGSSQVASDHQ